MGFGGTLVLQAANHLSGNDQNRLLQWFAQGSCSTQVIATASSPFFPLVERKAFLDALYYRLNVMCLPVGPRGGGVDGLDPKGC